MYQWWEENTGSRTTDRESLGFCHPSLLPHSRDAVFRGCLPGAVHEYIVPINYLGTFARYIDRSFLAKVQSTKEFLTTKC